MYAQRKVLVAVMVFAAVMVLAGVMVLACVIVLAHVMSACVAESIVAQTF